MTKLIVVWGFNRDEEGELRPVGEPMEAPSESSAIMRAKLMAPTHVGVIAWAREADMALGIYGEPEMLYKHGEIPDLEYGGE